ncbi:MAG: DinB family protein [Acidobacteria bacterium]|nr:DinB family protein [Acidobacteriota bacterium]
MLKETLIKLYRRDLEKLRAEIAAYRDEKNLWRVANDAPNSAGNLCLHLVGNLNTYLGAELGRTGYVRDRDREFSDRDISQNGLLEKVDATLTVVTAALEGLSEEDFAEDYPQIVFDEPMTTGYFLVHLATHLAYHLGQIDYHRRLLDAGENR